jgi:acyl carrier protein
LLVPIHELMLHDGVILVPEDVAVALRFLACADASHLTVSRWIMTGNSLMNDSTNLKADIKRMLVDSLMLQFGADSIADDQALFGPGSLGLDSVDALQIVVALDKNYGLKIPDPETARQVLHSVNTIAAALEAHRVAKK